MVRIRWDSVCDSLQHSNYHIAVYPINIIFFSSFFWHFVFSKLMTAIFLLVFTCSSYAMIFVFKSPHLLIIPLKRYLQNRMKCLLHTMEVWPPWNRWCLSTKTQLQWWPIKPKIILKLLNMAFVMQFLLPGIRFLSYTSWFCPSALSHSPSETMPTS